MKTDELKLTIQALRMEGQPFHRGGVTFQRCLLPFAKQEDGCWIAEPQRLFQPRGLAVWGAPAGTMLSFALCGAQLQVFAAVGTVPARFFAFGDSYEQLAKQIDEGKEPPAWCDWDPVTPGGRIRLEFVDASGQRCREQLELAMWGIAAL